MTKPLPPEEKQRRAADRQYSRIFRHQKEEWWVYTRLTGFKKWRRISKHRKETPAMVAMAEAFSTNHNIKRACVVHAVIPSWYDPTQVCELVRR